MNGLARAQAGYDNETPEDYAVVDHRHTCRNDTCRETVECDVGEDYCGFNGYCPDCEAELAEDE